MTLLAAYAAKSILAKTLSATFEKMPLKGSSRL
jgi:hypothetical protein